MRKTSHEGLDSTSITSGLENEIKKNSAAGLIKIKKSSIKRKVPNFSHESDDGTVEPLLQTDRERTETTTRSAKYLLTKAKTDSMSENEDSIKMSEMKLSNFSSSTPTTATNKVLHSNNAKNVKDTNLISNVAEVAPIHNHMNTNIFGGSEVSKAVISTKSPILVELDVGKTSGCNPSLIFTTAKIHTDCKTKLIEPIQVTSVPITSTFEKSAVLSASTNDTASKKVDISVKHDDTANKISENLNKTVNKLSTDQKSTPSEIIRNNSTSKNTLNLKDVKALGQISANNMDTNPLIKHVLENNESKKYDDKSANLMTSISNDKPILKNINTDVLKTKKADFLPESLNYSGKKAIVSSALENPISDNIMKLDKDFSISDKSEKKLTPQGSKKLQRQKKASVDDSHENASVNNLLKDKLPSDAKKMSIVTTTKSIPTTITITTSLVNKTTLSSSVTSSSSDSDAKIKTQPVVSSKSHVTMSPKVNDCKSQAPNSKISTPTTPTSHMKASLIPTATNRTTQGTNVIKPTISSKIQDKQDLTNTNKTPHSIKPDDKDSKDISSTVDKNSSTEITLPPYIVSTSKTKIRAPVVASATLKSEPTKSTVDSKNVPPNTKYLVKSTPSSSVKTTSVNPPHTTSSYSTKQSVTVKQIKSKADKQNEDSRA